MLPPVLCTLIVTFGAPLAVMWLAKRSRGLRQLGFVVVCYVAGAAVRNFAGDCVDGEIADHVSKTTILLAVPLLLFSLDFRGWLKSTTKASLSLLTAIAAVVVSAAVAALISDHRIDEPWKLAGMFSAVYIGGTANMGAVGVALDVKRETFLLANASDIILCAPYWLFLITVGPRIVARWLGERTAAMTETPPFGHDAQDGAALGRVPKPALVGAVALAAAIGAAGAAAAWMLTGRLSTAPGVLVVTTGGLAFSAVPRIRAIRGTGEAGHYLLLVFCVALGMTVDLSGTFPGGPIRDAVQRVCPLRRARPSLHSRPRLEDRHGNDAHHVDRDGVRPAVHRADGGRAPEPRRARNGPRRLARRSGGRQLRRSCRCLSLTLN
ncbi:MAG: DUF819 family protein [Deltaproteobacteria bacterium]|nr:DUF819 family protein [Deltaproteobacteria bacterium]